MGTILTFVVIFIAWKIIWYLGYVISIMTDNYYFAKMKWSMIKKLYPINPKKWTYNDNSPGNYVDKAMRNLRYDGTPIMLSFIDYQKLRYGLYKHGTFHNKQALEEILEDVQEDIEKKKIQVQKELEQANEMMARIGRKQLR